MEVEGFRATVVEFRFSKAQHLHSLEYMALGALPKQCVLSAEPSFFQSDKGFRFIGFRMLGFFLCHS